MKDLLDEDDKLFEGLYYHLGKLQTEKSDGYLVQIDKESQDLIYPKELDQWFEGYLKEKEFQERKVQNRKKLSNLSKWVALFLVVLTAGLSVTTNPVEAFKIKFFNMVSEITNRYTSVEFVETDKSNLENIEINWDSYLYPSYLPEGFDLTKVQAFGNTRWLYFSGPSEQQIEFSQSTDSTALQVDTEQADSRKVSIKGSPGWLVSKDGSSTLVWKRDSLTLYLVGNLSDQDMLKIAEQMKWIEK